MKYDGSAEMRVMMEQLKREKQMATGNILSILIKFGIPTMLGMIINALYNLVDTYFVGGFGMIQTAAVSLVFPLTLIVTGLGCVFGSGTGSKISRLLGDKQFDRARKYANVALMSATVCGIILSVILILFLEPVLRLMGADEAVLPYAVKYGRVIILGFLFSLLNITSNNIIVSEGATLFSSFALLTGAVLNIILDPVFIYVFHTGIEGVAYSTVISSVITTIMYACYFVSKKTRLKLSISRMKPEKIIYIDMMKIGVPMLVFQLLNMSTLSITNYLAAGYGNAILAAYGITYKLFCLEVNAVFGFLKGYQPLVGYNFGANLKHRVKQLTTTAIMITTIFCCCCNVILMIFAPQAIHLFNQDSTQVLQFGSLVLRIQAIGYMTLAFQFVGASYFLATGKAKQGGILSLCRGILFLILSLVLNAIFGSYGLLASYPITEFISSIITLMIICKSQKEEREQELEDRTNIISTEYALNK